MWSAIIWCSSLMRFAPGSCSGSTRTSTDGVEVVVLFKILVGVVENHERAFLYRLQFCREAGFQRIEVGGGLGGVVPVFGGVGGVDGGQFARGLLKQQFAARDAQPEVRVVGAVVVAVMVMALFVAVLCSWW